MPSVTRCTSGVSGPTPSADTTDRVVRSRTSSGSASGAIPAWLRMVRAIGPHTSDSP